jgi:outer membrane protein OmpA-like peptidoglycan-associated protein/tetratricopeptide (TPR) repeat protein
MSKSLYIILILSVFLGLTEYSYSFSDDNLPEADTTISIDENLIQKAHKAYENMAYKKAIDFYERLIDRSYLNANIYQKLADSYYKTRNTRKAEEYYKILVTSTIHRKSDVYDLVKVLKYNGKYEEAEKWMERYLKGKEKKDSSGVNDNYNLSARATEIKSFPRYKIDTLPFNTKYSEFGPAIHDDYLYFTSQRKRDEIIEYEYVWDETSFLDIYKIKLDNFKAPPKHASGKITSKFHDGPLCFSSDGTDLYYSSNNKNLAFFPTRGENGVTHLKIFHAAIEGDKISNPEELAFNSDNYSCSHPSLSEDNDTLFYTCDKSDGFGGSDIYYSVKEGSEWSEPINAGGDINTERDEMFPYKHESGVLYFASEGHLGLGGLDIYKAVPQGEGYKIENMGYPLNTRFDDFSIIFSKGAKKGYFASNRKGGAGKDDIYKFIMTREKRGELTIQGKIFDKKTEERIDNPSVTLEDSDGNTRRLMFFKESVDYSFSVDPKKAYTLKVNKEGYFPKEKKFDRSELLGKTDKYKHNIYLKKKPVWGITGEVYESDGESRISEVNIVVKNRLTSEKTTYQSDKEGKFRIKLTKNTDYYLTFKKDGYKSLHQEYYTRGRKAGWVDLNKIMDLTLAKVEKKDITYLTGKVKDKSTDEGVKAKIQFIDNDKNKIAATYLCGKNGRYRIKLPEIKTYGVEITAEDYLYYAEQVDFSNLSVKNDSIHKDFILEPIEVGKKVVIENIFFETGKSKLKPESYEALDKILELLRNNKSLKLEIAGHTDNVGSYSSNKKLSTNRAKSVVDYLVGHGIDESRLEYKGYSFTEPIAPNSTPEGRQKNRRVEFEILEK